jgi:hypothetical protein
MSTELEQTIAQRRGRYGPLIESGEVAMKLEDYLRSLPGWQNLAYDQREALAMVMHKISRIMCGDPDYDDSWIDIAGYAQNVVNRLRAEQADISAPFGPLTPVEVFASSGISPEAQKDFEDALNPEVKRAFELTESPVNSLLRAEVKDR